MSVVTSRDLPLVVREFQPGDVVPEALILQATTDSGVPVGGDDLVVSVPYIDADDDAGFVAEGAQIDEADPDVTNVAVATGKVAELGKISSEQWAEGHVANLLSLAFKRAIVKKANRAFLAQVAPTPPAINPPAGILSQGITDGGTVAADLDAVVDAVAAVEEAYGAVDVVLANPTSWGELTKLKTGAGSNASLLGAGSADAARALLSVPVLTSPAVPTGTLVLVDRSSILSAVGQVRVAVSDQAYFSSDSVGLRVTWRFGARVVDPSRVVKLSIGS